MARQANALVSFRGIFGSLGAPVEEWQFGLRLTRDPAHDVFTEAQFQTLAEQAQSVYSTTIRASIPSWAVLTETRFVLVSIDGTTDRRLDGSYKQGIADSNLPGMHPQANRHPLQTALAVSTMTVRQGPTGKGRFYLPAPGIALENDFSIPSDDALAVANNAADLISGLNAMGAGNVSVFSSKGYDSRVTGVRVGQVMDTMRSRRRAQPEGYVEATEGITS